MNQLIKGSHPLINNLKILINAKFVINEFKYNLVTLNFLRSYEFFVSNGAFLLRLELEKDRMYIGYGQIYGENERGKGEIGCIIFFTSLMQVLGRF